MTATTPMMVQYTRIKQLHKDAILFYRLGDFYEMFQQDAKEASGILGLTLTRRNGVPMCGIPYHASHGYIEKLLRAGKKIAVCEQTKLPQNGKGIAEREVVEVITPGTVVDEDFLEKGRNNFLAALAEVNNGFSLSCVDLSTGEFQTTFLPPEGRLEGLKRELTRLDPREILVQESLLNSGPEVKGSVVDRKGIVINALPDWSFNSQNAYASLCRHFAASNLKGFGFEADSPELVSAGVVLEYLEENAKVVLSHIRNLRKYKNEDFLALDEATLRNLELVSNLHDGGGKYTLREVLDHTKTAMGGRTLRKWILEPLVDREKILSRQNLVDILYHGQASLSRLRELLSDVYDLQRLSARLALDKAHAKDLLAVMTSLAQASQIHGLYLSVGGQDPFGETALKELKDIEDLLKQGIAEDPSVLLTEGNLIREDYDAELDELRNLQKNSRKVLSEYLEQEKEISGIPNLKVRYNKIIGYFIEVTKGNLQSVPAHFIRRQSLVTGERYTTERLIELETLLNNSHERIVELEKELFLKIRNSVKKHVSLLLDMAAFLGTTDALQSLARAATIHGFTKPELTIEPGLFIKEGRHPVVEMYLPPGEFVPNSLSLEGGKKSFALLTGPNMAGKSTYLRQTALICLMGQMGSFVPAEEATLGIVDKIFCRVGAQDNLARGESTFLVEMNETAYILRTATSESLVIMDEVGRGTSTNDGLSIAWAVCEYILNSVQAKTLFATHYHELTVLDHNNLLNLSMDIREKDGEIVFLKKVKNGPSNNSYGIHVAKLAGLPSSVLKRAEEILDHVVRTKEGGSGAHPPSSGTSAVKQGNLFSSAEILEEEIRRFPVDKSTPLDALNFLSKWRNLLLSESSGKKK